jgi:hypothetical protein
MQEQGGCEICWLKDLNTAVQIRRRNEDGFIRHSNLRDAVRRR